MVLHMAQPAFPIDSTSHVRAGNIAVKTMHYVFVFICKDVNHPGLAQGAGVVGLAAAGGIEVALVKNNVNLPPIRFGLVNDFCLELSCQGLG
jgi:hypothetical protein